MDVLLDQKTMIPLLVGAALALLGGGLTQLIFWRIALAHSKAALVTAFRAELRVIRANLGSELSGYRLSLRADDPPTPTVFVVPTPVFTANAGQLGQLRDPDLVEHIVEVYNHVESLSAHAALYKGFANSQISLSDLNSMQMDATIAHVLVMKLHNRLSEVPPDGKINKNDTEIESRKLLDQYTELLKQGEIQVILGQKWVDA